MMMFSRTLRRSAWIRWLPPIDSASPSPEMTQTSRSGPGGRQPGGDGRRPPVDRVHPVGVHVVREAGRAADAGEEHRVLPAHAEVGHEHLDGGQDGVVAAARAPAHLLVARPVLAGGHGDGGGHAAVAVAVRAVRAVGLAHDFPPSSAVIAASISPTRNGTPCILDMVCASTRNSARSIRLSWPRLISGTRTWV